MVSNQAMARAIDALKAGRALVFPTDTVYGLGVAVRYADTPREVFDLKRRPADKPIAWLIGSPNDLSRYGAEVSSQAFKLAEDGWPGALTLIVKASAEVPPAYRSAQGTIGLRVPASETALALIREVGPLAASSANLSGQATPLTFDEIAPEITSKVVAIEDDKSICGQASTVIDCTQATPRILRS